MAFKVSHYPATFGGHEHYGSGDIIVLFCHLFSQDHVTKALFDLEPIKISHHLFSFGGHGYYGLILSRDQSVIWLYDLEPLKLSHHSFRFGGHGHYGSGDIIVLVCHVILQVHVIKVSCNYKGKSSSRKVTILPSLVVIDILIGE